MKVIVWHHNRDLAEAKGFAGDVYSDVFCWGENKPALLLRAAGCYEPVAIFQYDDEDRDAKEVCEDAYSRTQHGNPNLEVSDRSEDGLQESRDWNRQPKHRNVTVFHNTGNRSSMVGDIFEVIKSAPEGLLQQTFICKAMGFEEIVPCDSQ